MAKYQDPIIKKNTRREKKNFAIPKDEVIAETNTYVEDLEESRVTKDT